jgi:hypothetical protein
MRYLGIDYGAKRIGLAVSDEAGTIAFPRETIANMSGAIAAIRAIIQKEHIGFVVVGDTTQHTRFLWLGSGKLYRSLALRSRKRRSQRFRRSRHHSAAVS